MICSRVFRKATVDLGAHTNNVMGVVLKKCFVFFFTWIACLGTQYGKFLWV